MQKLKTTTSYYERINKVLEHIEAHLYEEISLETLSSVSCFSSYHFHRIFNAVVGDSLQVYIRRTRLQKAAQSLIYSEKPIIDIAFKAQFESQAGFNKAFKKLFGMTPMNVRKKGSIGEYVNPYFFPTKTLEEFTMKYEIQNLEKKAVLFVRRTGSYFESAPAAWGAMHEHLESNAIDYSHGELIGVAYDDPASCVEDKLRFDACVANLEGNQASGEVGVKEIEGGKYAVFTHKGSYDQLGETYRKIYGQALPANDIELRDLPAFIHYVGREADWFNQSNDSKEMECKIYLPIV